MSSRRELVAARAVLGHGPRRPVRQQAAGPPARRRARLVRRRRPGAIPDAAGSSPGSTPGTRRDALGRRPADGRSGDLAPRAEVGGEHAVVLAAGRGHGAAARPAVTPGPAMHRDARRAARRPRARPGAGGARRVVVADVDRVDRVLAVRAASASRSRVATAHDERRAALAQRPREVVERVEQEAHAARRPGRAGEQALVEHEQRQDAPRAPRPRRRAQGCRRRAGRA